MQSDIRPGRFEILPVVIKNLLIINGLVWLAQLVIDRNLFSIEQVFALHYYRSEFYHPWQLLTYMFLHSPGDPFHILFNMFALWIFGSTLENLWGPKRFLLFYLLCGFIAGLVQMGAYAFDMRDAEALFGAGMLPEEQYRMLANIPTMGASGAVMGIFAAFAYTFPNSQLFIFPIPFPIKAKWALLGLAALDLFSGFSSKQTGIAHFAHLGGAAAGIILVILWNRRNRRTFY